MKVTSFVVTSPEELHRLITEAVQDALRRNHKPTTEWMTVKEAAEYLRCPASRLYKHTANRTIPFRKEGDRLLFRRDELDSWVDESS